MITLTKGAVSVQIKNPELGDTVNLNLNTVRRRAMSGKLYSYLSPIRKRHELSFVVVSNMDEIIIFMRDAIGYPITYTDYNGGEHIGYIVPGTFKYTYIDPCTANFSMTFEEN